MSVEQQETETLSAGWVLRRFEERMVEQDIVEVISTIFRHSTALFNILEMAWNRSC